MSRIFQISFFALIMLGFLGESFAEKVPNYVGADKCRKCHKKKKLGNQYKVWSEKPHAKAFETLKSDTSKIVAKNAGVEGNPWEAPECLKCHVTAYEEDASIKDSTLTMEEGISCEACHGPGSLYKKKKIMKDVEKARKLGLIDEPDEESCKVCHNEDSPTYKEFNFEERKEDIAHPLPEKKDGEKDDDEDEDEEEEE